MTKPRAYTVEECREKLFEGMADSLKYWRDLSPVTVPEDRTELHYRMEGFLFSVLVMLDDGSMDLPGFNIVPVPHEEDEAYHKSVGENWWPTEVINDIQMHEVFPWNKCR